MLREIMTDDEYTRLLSALAGKHLRSPRQGNVQLERDLETLSSTARLLKAVSERRDDQFLLDHLLQELNKDSPIERAGRHLEEVGILDALDEAPSLVFGHLRRSVVPREDIEFLRRAGYTDDEIEVLLAVAIDQARVLANRTELPSEVVGRASEALSRAAQLLPAWGIPAAPEERKKRKILNGIGKILGGAIAGVGNALLVAGTIAAPNPATASGAIASGGIALSSLFAGMGDLRGE
jgi:hypothetical protein